MMFFAEKVTSTTSPLTLSLSQGRGNAAAESLKDPLPLGVGGRDSDGVWADDDLRLPPEDDMIEIRTGKHEEVIKL